MRNLLRKKLFWKFIVSSAFFFVGAIFVLSSPGKAAAAPCEDQAKWGINTGNPNHGAGLVVRTQNASGAALGGIGWVLRTATGPSILHLQSSSPYNDIGWDSARAFFTATGPSNTSQFHGAVWCNAGRTTRGSFKGYSVLGVGSSLWYGNNMLLSCKRYLGAWDDACDSNDNGTCTDEPVETYRIQENDITHPGGQSGHWTGSLAGWDTGFTVPNGRTTRITLTWHKDAPDPPGSPTNTLHVRSSNPSSGVVITQLSSCSVGTGGTTPYDVPTIINICTDIRASEYAAGNTKKFSHWEGCDWVYPFARDCRAGVVGGATQTVTAHYVDNTGRIKGKKVGPNPAASQTVKLNGGSPTTSNPYAYNDLVAGNYTVSVSAPAGWKVGYTLCYNITNCHGPGNTPTMASSVVVSVPAGGYADLYWHYYPLDLVVKSVVVTNGTEFHVGDEVLVDVTVENTKGGTAGAFWVEVCPSGNKPLINCPNAGTGKWTYKEEVTSLASGVSVVETFSFPAPDPGSYPKTYTLVARADLPDPGKVLEAVEYTNNWGKATYKVIGPPPWFQTEIGDVGSIGRIEPDDPPQKAGEYSADYLVVSNSFINRLTFTSFRDWLVPDYTGINVRPAPESGSIYQAFFNKYKPDTSSPIGSIGEIPATGGERVYFVSGSLVVPGGGVSYDKEPAVVFVKEHMNINGNIQIDEPTGLIFVVNDYVRVKKKVYQADGVYIFDEDYEVRSKGNSSERQLEVNGSVLGAFDSGEFLLERDFRSADSWERPTELFIFEPKYLWLFRDTLGDVKTRFDEVAP